MTIKLHRCPNEWVKVKGHPCWKVQSALDDMGIEYEVAKGPLRRSKRDELDEKTGRRLYPAIEFEDGSFYREESKDMERTIRDGKLMERAGTAAATSG
jgi:glutathione S-transferase-like protein